MSPLNSVTFLKKLSMYIKKEHYSNFSNFEIATLVSNVPGHYLRKYGTYKELNLKYFYVCTYNILTRIHAR